MTQEQYLQRGIEIVKILTSFTYQAYLVGGVVRDYLMNNEFNDIDIATNATPEQVKELFPNVRMDYAHLGFVTLKEECVTFEISTFREEVYDKPRKPSKIYYANNLVDDVKRRDFTINAIYLDCSTNQIIDPYDGLKDLFTFKIKFIGEPKERIKQDPTRILRGLRLAYKLNFEIEENTNNAFKECFEEIKRLSKTRLNKEIEKMELELGKEKTESILKLYNID